MKRVNSLKNHMTKVVSPALGIIETTSVTVCAYTLRIKGTGYQMDVLNFVN